MFSDILIKCRNADICFVLQGSSCIFFLSKSWAHFVRNHFSTVKSHRIFFWNTSYINKIISLNKIMTFNIQPIRKQEQPLFYNIFSQFRRISTSDHGSQTRSTYTSLNKKSMENIIKVNSLNLCNLLLSSCNYIYTLHSAKALLMLFSVIF